VAKKLPGEGGGEEVHEMRRAVNEIAANCPLHYRTNQKRYHQVFILCGRYSQPICMGADDREELPIKLVNPTRGDLGWDFARRLVH